MTNLCQEASTAHAAFSSKLGASRCSGPQALQELDQLQHTVLSSIMTSIVYGPFASLDSVLAKTCAANRAEHCLGPHCQFTWLQLTLSAAQTSACLEVHGKPAHRRMCSLTMSCEVGKVHKQAMSNIACDMCKMGSAGTCLFGEPNQAPLLQHPYSAYSCTT